MESRLIPAFGDLLREAFISEGLQDEEHRRYFRVAFFAARWLATEGL